MTHQVCSFLTFGFVFFFFSSVCHSVKMPTVVSAWPSFSFTTACTCSYILINGKGSYKWPLLTAYMLCCTEQVRLGWRSFIPSWDLGLQSTLSYISHLAKQAWQRDLWSRCRHECCCNDSFQGECTFFPSTVRCSKYAESWWKSQQQRSHGDQVARYVALALLPRTNKTNQHASANS